MEMGSDVNMMVVLLHSVSAKSCRATGGNAVHLAKGWWQTPCLDDSEACSESSFLPELLGTGKAAFVPRLERPAKIPSYPELGIESRSSKALTL